MYENIQCTKIDSTLSSSLRSQLLNCLYYSNPPVHEGQSFRFPASQPVFLSRRDFDFLKRAKYWVCEKSEGVRVLVLSLRDGVFLCDENFEFYGIDLSLVCLPSVDGDFCQNKTILDCQLTYNFHFNTYCLMICDIMYIEGKRVMEYPLSQRLKVIGERVIVPFRNKYSEEEQKNLPLFFLGKDYYDLSQINSLLSFIQKFEEKDEPSGVRYLYQKRVRYNDSVGLIFTSEDKCYKPDVCVSLKQWKWLKLNTFYFVVRVTTNDDGSNTFRFFVKAEESLYEYREVSLNNDSKTRLLADLNGENEAVVECFFDINEGEWIYYKICSEKNPTPFSCILQQMEVISENITEEELKKLQTRPIKSRTSPRKFKQNSYYNNIRYHDPSPKDEIVYESPIKTEGIKTINPLKRKINESNLDSPEIEYISVKKARLSPKVTSTSPFCN